jgi:hypothetical protein
MNKRTIAILLFNDVESSILPGRGKCSVIFDCRIPSYVTFTQ